MRAAVAELVPLIDQAAPGVPNARWIAIRLLDGDVQVEEALTTGRLASLVAGQQKASDELVIVAGRAHGDGERLAGDADFERFLDHDLVVALAARAGFDVQRAAPLDALHDGTRSMLTAVL